MSDSSQVTSTDSQRSLEPAGQSRISGHLAEHLIEQSTTAMVVVDHNAVIVRANRRATQLLGSADGGAVPESLLDLIPSPHHDDFWKRFRAIQTGDQLSGEHRILRPGGHKMTVEYSLRRLADGMYFGAARDVSPRADAQEEALRQKELVEAVVHSSPDGILAFDSHGRITAWNPAMVQMSGVDSADVLGRLLAECFPGARPDQIETLLSVLDGMTVVDRQRPFFIPRSAGGASYEARYSPMRDPHQVVRGGLGIVRDVTDRQTLESRLLHAQKMESVGRLAGGIAHDFNNVLTVILGEVALALGAGSGEDRARQALERIRDAAERAGSVTRKLLAFSRRQFMSPAVFSLSQLVEELEPMLRHLIGEDVELEIHHSDERMPVRADRGHLEQVLANLVVNAREAMPDGGTLTITTGVEDVNPDSGWRIGSTPRGRHAIMAVRDTGVGIPEDVRDRLFEPFFTTKPRGTGLGLSTCYGIVQQSRGDISIESEPGQGTVIRVCFPIIEGVAETPAPTSAVLPRGTETVLLAEDEAGVRKVVGQLLRSLGYRVFEADDGQVAVDFLAACAEPIDLILTDVVMPRLGGRELAERARSLRPEAAILFMSGYSDDAVLRRQVEQEGAPLLTKPITERALALKVRSVLDRVDSAY